ncbi:growth arrest-specific protein 2-like [Tachypleus tridentatus]|uniref:growth arrest-specific protein 2-like n=1 Tax=Tachypleus tridentatus TaxID=6853 RepID=UPI003FD36129
MAGKEQCKAMSDEQMWDDFKFQIAKRQEENLIPLKEDLADWINKILDVETITIENFMEALDNGIIICKLAKLIQRKAESCRQEGLSSEVVPQMSFKCWENARSKSFFARENAENFLKWCRKFGVREAVIFESEGLVLHTQPRAVVLCLLELGRIASKYGIEPPGLVKLEKEIDEHESTGSTIASDSESISPVPSLIPIYSPRMECTPPSLSPVPMPKTDDSSSSVSPTPMCTGADSTDSVASASSQNSVSPPLLPSPVRSNETPVKPRPKSSDLDKKVMQIADDVLEDKAQIKKVSEGRYSVAGKSVFVRLLKGRHVMVRVGGGWDTLEHFLSRHRVTDPSQVKLIDSKQAWSDVNSQPSNPLSNGSGSESLLNARAKHRNSMSSLPDISHSTNSRKRSVDIQI